MRIVYLIYIKGQVIIILAFTYIIWLSINRQMQEETHTKQKQFNTLPDDYQILQLIQRTFLSKTTADVSQAQSTLNQLLQHDTFIQKLFSYLETQNLPHTQNPQQFKTSVAILIKRFSYQFSKKQNINKDLFVQKIFCLLISKLNIKAKEPLGTALEYVLNHDQENEYKPKVISKVTEILESQPDSGMLEGCLIISVSCLNSLIEADDQFTFLWSILDSLVRNAINILETLKKIPSEALMFEQSKQLLKLSRRIFDLMELGFSRLLEQEDLLQDKLDQIRHHPTLQMAFFSYLANFSYRKSILSIIPEINSVKQIVVEIIFNLYRTKPMPQNIFNLFFLTFLLQAERHSYEEEEQHIVIRVMELMEDYLDNKFFMHTFTDHKMQTLMALITYCVSKPEEFDMLEEEPQRFVELAEEFTEAFKSSVNIKVRAASFLRVFAARFDEALRNILQIMVIVITAHLQSGDPQSPCLQLYNNLKEQFSSMTFFNLDPSLQLQTCFNILSLLSIYISKRDDLNKIVYAIFITHFDKLQKIETPIVVLRLIRAIGYYPTAVYYNVIKGKMSLGRVFVLQGLKSFERILKANRYPEIFDLLSEIFSELITIMNVNDHIFETILMNHYERILKKNLTLYNNFLMKIRDTFVQNLQKNQHFAFTCLGYIYSILNKENQSTYRQKVVQYFQPMQQFYNKAIEFYRQKLSQPQQQQPSFSQNKKILKMLQHYQDKIIDIYSLLVKKQPTISPRTIQFSLNKLQSLNQHNRNEEIFKMYNNLFLKLDNQFQQVGVYYEALMNHLRNIFMPLLTNEQTLNNNVNKKQNMDIVPNLSYLISQIFACFYEVHLRSEDLQWMLKVLNSLTEDLKQYLLLIILTYTYVQPLKLKDMLKSLNLYEETLKYLLTTNYTEGLIRKIFLLAMSKLLEIEDIYFEDILRQCIKYLNEQFRQNQTKNKKKEHVDPKMRRMLQDSEFNQEEEMIEEKNNSKSNTACSVPEFKHPYTALSEYDQFKIRIWHNVQIVEKLSEKDKNDLREILRMDWIGKGVRKIVSVKQPFDSF